MMNVMFYDVGAKFQPNRLPVRFHDIHRCTHVLVERFGLSVLQNTEVTSFFTFFTYQSLHHVTEISVQYITVRAFVV